MATFTDIVKEQRSQGAGVFSSLGKAAGQRTLERIDPRNYLFKRNGLATALFSGLKGYQAGSKKQTSSLSDSSSSLSSAQSDSITSKLDELKVVQQETAKNTLVLPIIARDMNIMRQNILKLVKLSGGKPSSRADSFFLSAKQREEAYESRFGNKSKSPTALNPFQTKKEGGFFSDLFSGLLKASLIAGALAGLAKYFNDPEFRKKVNEMLDNFGKVIFGEKYWGELKTKIKTGFDTIIDEIKKFAKVVLEIFVGLKVAGLLLNRQLARLTLAGIPGKVAMATGAAEAAAGTAAVAAAKSAKGPTVGKDPKTGKFIKKPLTKWDRFLKYLAKKSPKLFARVGAKLTTMALGAAVPGIGVLFDLLLGIFLISDAYLIYQYYKEFSGQEDKTTPTPIENDLNSTNLMTNEKGETSPLYSGQSTSGTSPTPIGSPLISSKSSGDIEKAEEYLGRKINSEEWDALSRAVYAESSRNKNEYANVMAVILNRARNSGKSIFEVLNEKNQFQAVTGTVDNPGPSQNYLKGPGPNEAAMILESTSSLASISKDLDAFTSANPKAYTKGTNISYLQKLKDAGGQQIGQTMFAENQYSGKGTSSSLASAASAMPNINDMGKFLNEGSTEFENMIRDFMKSSGDTFINSDSSKKVVSSGSNQVPPVGSVWDKQIIPSLLGAPQMT